jgi:predicted nucleotidyltransferase
MLRSMLEQNHRTTRTVMDLAQRLLTYLEHKVDPHSIKDELHHEEDGLRILITLDKKVMTLARGSVLEPIITMHDRDCRLLIDLFERAGSHPENLDFGKLEEALKDLYEQDIHLVRAA